MKVITTLVCLFLILCMGTAVAQGNRIEQLEQKILEQQKVLNDLEKRLEQKQSQINEYTEEVVQEYMSQPATTEMAVSAGYDKGFFIQSGDGAFKLKINGWIKNFLYISEANTVQHNTFRDAIRVDFHIYYEKDWHVRIRPEWVDGGFSVKEAYLEYLGIPQFQPRIGGHITPFSMERESDPATVLAIVYPTFVQPLPFRDVGFAIYGAVPGVEDYASYAAGIYNGDGEGRLNTDDNFMYVGQLKAYPLGKKENVFVQAGFYYDIAGFKEEGARLRLEGLQNHEVFESVIGNDFDDLNGRQMGASFAYRYWRNNLRIEGEYVWARMNRNREPGRIDPGRSSLEMWGISSGISYLFDIGDSGLGFEPLFKVCYTTIDDRNGDGSGAGIVPFGTPTDFKGQDIWEITFGFKVHFSKHIRGDFNWTMYDLKETRGLSNNDNYGNDGGGLLHAFLFQMIAIW